MVEVQFGKKLDETSVFLFCGHRADRIKALYWDGEYSAPERAPRPDELSSG